MRTRRTFTTLHDIARRLGVPAEWLRTEATAGRVPHIRAGRRLLFHAEDVERVLRERAGQEEREGQPA